MRLLAVGLLLVAGCTTDPGSPPVSRATATTTIPDATASPTSTPTPSPSPSPTPEPEPAAIEVVSFTQVATEFGGSWLHVRLRNPNNDVGLVRSPFKLAMLDANGGIIGVWDGSGLPGSQNTTIYQLPPGGEYALDAMLPQNTPPVASVELTIPADWVDWSTVTPATVTVTDAVIQERAPGPPAVTGRVAVDDAGPLNVYVAAFVSTPAGPTAIVGFVDCVTGGTARAFEVPGFSTGPGPWTLEKVIAYVTTVPGVGLQEPPGC